MNKKLNPKILPESWTLSLSIYGDEKKHTTREWLNNLSDELLEVLRYRLDVWFNDDKKLTEDEVHDLFFMTILLFYIERGDPETYSMKVDQDELEWMHIKLVMEVTIEYMLRTKALLSITGLKKDVLGKKHKKEKSLTFEINPNIIWDPELKNKFKYEKELLFYKSLQKDLFEDMKKKCFALRPDNVSEEEWNIIIKLSNELNFDDFIEMIETADQITELREHYRNKSK